MVGLEFGDIQSVVLSGHAHLNHFRILAGNIEDARAARRWLAQVLPLVSRARRRRPREPKPDYHANVAFTAEGLRTIGLTGDAMATFPREFVMGMDQPERSRKLGDWGASAPDRWQFGGPRNPPIHVLTMLYARSGHALESLTARIYSTGYRAPTECFRQDSSRHSPNEPFGFRDGISQPAVEGSHQKPMPGETTVKAGEFVLGYQNEYGIETSIPTVASARDPNNVLITDLSDPSRKLFGRNGSFLVLRKLAQDVDGFWRYVDQQTRNPDGSSNPNRKTMLAAKLVGRWPSGAPLTLAPERDDPELGSDSRRNNDFNFLPADPFGYACPIGSHIRRCNPRDALFLPTDGAPSPEQRQLSIKSANRHRMIRRGRPYAELDHDGKVHERGLLFIAINAEILRQFELVQQTWLNNPKFNGLYNDKDPIAGDNDGSGTMTIQANPLRGRVHGLPRFVTVKGGGYFFLPGLKALHFLAGTD